MDFGEIFVIVDVHKQTETCTGPVQIWFHIFSAQKGGYMALSKFFQCFTNNADDGIKNTHLKFADSAKLGRPHL